VTIDPQLAAAMSERAWQAHVEGLLRFYGWRHFHAPDNKPTTTRAGRAARQHVEPGFPDIAAVRRLPGYGPELLFAELKAERGRYGPGQKEWLTDLAAFRMALLNSRIGHGRTSDPSVGVYTWRPSDALEVEETLAGPRGVGVPVDLEPCS
jgi:hypothetical protein